MTDSAPQSLEVLVAEHAPFLGRLARALVGDRQRADDLVQDTWATALQDPASLHEIAESGSGRLRGWLAVVLRRKSMSVGRREGVRRASELGDVEASDWLTPEETATRLERQKLVQDALLALPEPYRTTLVLRFQDGLSAVEIAKAGGVPSSTVRSQMTRGLALLREALDQKHKGGRAEWLAALVPLAYPGRSSAATFAAGVGSTSPWTAVGAALAMNKLLVGAVLVLLAVYFAGTMRGGTDAPLPSAVLPASGPDELEELALAGGADGEGVADRVALRALPEASSMRALAGGNPLSGADAPDDAAAADQGPEATALSAGSRAISGRAMLLDGTPIRAHVVNAKSTSGDAHSLRVTTDDDGRFELLGLSADTYTVELQHHGDILGAEEVGVQVPASGLELRVDAIVFRPTIPRGFDLASFAQGSGYTVMSYGAEGVPAASFSYGGFAPSSDQDVRQELLPVGPGYMALVSAGGIPMAAAVDPGAPSGVYEVEFSADSSSWCAVEVVLSGASVAAPSYVTIGFERVVGDGEEWFPCSSHMPAGTRRSRMGVLLPGEYRVDPSIFGPPPIAWVTPSVRGGSFSLKPGEENLVEVELVEGGGLALEFRAQSSVDNAGPTLEHWDPETESWRRYSTYVPTDDGGYRMGAVDCSGVLYRSWRPHSVGEARFRLSGGAFETAETTLHIRAGELTEWKPFLERKP